MAADSKVKLQNEAEKLMLQGKIPQAIGEYLKIVQNYPEDFLTLNTVGDLYLTAGNAEEANKCFTRVAENYVRNNFFLKAIAVYKKILKNDPDNQEINSKIASLYAKQGLNNEACNQYLHLIKLLQDSGNDKEIIKIYETIAELDPSSIDIQVKLADIFLAGKQDEKGREHLLNAARALAKKNDHASAIDYYDRAFQIDPLDITTLKGFTECCLKTGDHSAIIKRLNEILESDPDNLDIKEMLGKIHLAGGDPDAAIDILKTVVASEESRYECFIPVAEALIAEEKYDRAAACLDLIIPTLISCRKTDIAVKQFTQILERCPDHLPTLEQLASIYLSAGDIARHLEVLDKVIDLHIDQKNPIVALEYLEKILKTDPESKKHLDLHKAVFTEVNPDAIYTPPVAPPETRVDTSPIEELAKTEKETDPPSESVVEADLLINYGMKEKALSLLQNLEAMDPNDKKVRTRLLMLYKEENKFTEAAEQCLLLAALHKKSNDEESAEKYLTEARQLDPDTVDRNHDLDLFARKKGIALETASGRGGDLKSDLEVDLSGDLLDIFFTGKQDEMGEALADIPSIPNEIPEGYSEGITSPPATQSIDEKLQEVDFYIRLGFRDEASNKLNEIAKINPDHPELPSRFEKLQEIEESENQESDAETASGTDGSGPDASEKDEAFPDEDINMFEDFDIDEGLENFGESFEEAANAEDAGINFEIPEDKDADSQTFLEENIEIPQPAPEADSESATADFAIVEEQNDSAKPESPESRALSAEAGAPPEESRPKTAPKPDTSEFIVNDMFSDLLEEVSTLSEQAIAKESFEDHFSLGTAYRDMDLIEEAIKEFQTAIRISENSKDSKKLIQCCGMLSTCFLKKNMPRSALRWCQTGLNVEDISPQEEMALRYDMGVSHFMEGNRDLALNCFDQIFSIDPGYRDVALKIDEIKSGQPK